MTVTTRISGGYLLAPNRVLTAANGIDYAYRELGEGGHPWCCSQHFRGNLDNWDPALIDALASRSARRHVRQRRRGRFDGNNAEHVTEMARDAVAFLDAMGFVEVDLVGFSIGSFVAQEVALIRPGLVRRLVLASAAPQGAAGMHGWASKVIEAVGGRAPNPEGYLSVFFTGSSASRRLGIEALGTDDRPERGPGQTDDVADPARAIRRGVRLGRPRSRPIPAASSAIDMPVFIANGDSDPMILPRFSYLLAGLIPDARVKIYPDAAHGFLFQHHAQFADDVDAFLHGTS